MCQSYKPASSFTCALPHNLPASESGRDRDILLCPSPRARTKLGPRHQFSQHLSSCATLQQCALNGRDCIRWKKTQHTAAMSGLISPMWPQPTHTRTASAAASRATLAARLSLSRGADPQTASKGLRLGTREGTLDQGKTMPASDRRCTPTPCKLVVDAALQDHAG